MGKEETVNAGGINGLGLDLINPESADFRALQRMISEVSDNLPEEQRIANRMLAIRFRMESYLNQPRPEEILPAGQFIEEFLDLLEIKQKDFADYIECEASNLNAILKGRRKINPDLALKFGHIFKVDPAIWLHLQSKNELLALEAAEGAFYDRFGLEELLKKGRA